MAFTLSFDAATPAGLHNLNVFLQSRSYVVGFHPTQTDVELFDAIGKAPDAAAYPNVARYYSHIASFAADVRAKWHAAFGAHAGKAAAKTAAAPAKAAAPAPKPAAKVEEEEEDADLFGDDGDAAAAAAAAKVSKPVEEKKEKKVEVSKTAVIYEVKPLEAGQDMKAMEAAIREIAMDGLLWGEEFKVVDVAYGIQKLIVQAVVEDEKVGLQDIEDKFELLTEIIQSFDMINMNKVAGR